MLDWPDCRNVRDLGGCGAWPEAGQACARTTTREAIVADYTLSGDRLRHHLTPAGDPVAARLALRGTTIAEALGDLLTGTDIEARLRAAGLTTEDLHAVRERLIDG